MRKHRIAIISDTHGILRQEAAGVLRSVELILHGGDIADRELLERLNEFAGVTAVRGNCDREWAEYLPQEVFLELYGKRIYMIHNKKHISKKAEDADIIIYGHSHKYEVKEKDGRLWLNPGSSGPERFGRPATMAVLELEEETGGVTVERINLSGTDLKKTEAGDSSGSDAGRTDLPADRTNSPNAEKTDLSADGTNSPDTEKTDLPADGTNSPDAEKTDLPVDETNSPDTEKTDLPADGMNRAVQEGQTLEFGSGELQSMVAQIVKDLGRGRTVERIVAARGVSRALTEQVCQIYFTHPGIDLQGVLDRMEIAGR